MRSKRKNILFVENDRFIAEAIKDMLERHDFEVTVSSRSTEALILIQSQPEIFDVVVSALNLPNLNGVELAKEVHDVRTDMPFILCTGDGRIKEDEIKKLGVIKKIFYKPFSLVDFIEEIKIC